MIDNMGKTKAKESTSRIKWKTNGMFIHNSRIDSKWRKKKKTENVVLNFPFISAVILLSLFQQFNNEDKLQNVIKGLLNIWADVSLLPWATDRSPANSSLSPSGTGGHLCLWKAATGGASWFGRDSTFTIPTMHCWGCQLEHMMSFQPSQLSQMTG